MLRYYPHLYIAVVIMSTGCEHIISPTENDKCTSNIQCPVGLYCSDTGSCAQDCVVDVDCAGDGARCNERGQCVGGDSIEIDAGTGAPDASTGLIGDESPENPYNEDPNYTSVIDLGGEDPSPQAYGTLLGEYRGVTAHSNHVPCEPSPGCRFGIGDGRTEGMYGYQYQCVEYAVRFYAEALGYANMNGNGDAKSWWLAPKHPAGKALIKHANGGTVAPKPDDILVFGGGLYGHLAIIRDVGDDYVKIIQQNWFHNAADGSHELSMTVNGGQYVISSLGSAGQYEPFGWLRAPQSVEDPAPGDVLYYHDFAISQVCAEEDENGFYIWGSQKCSDGSQFTVSNSGPARIGFGSQSMQIYFATGQAPPTGSPEDIVFSVPLSKPTSRDLTVRVRVDNPSGSESSTFYLRTDLGGTGVMVNLPYGQNWIDIERTLIGGNEVASRVEILLGGITRIFGSRSFSITKIEVIAQ